MHSKKMAPQECFPRAAFQVTFKGGGFRFLREPKITDEMPWPVPFRVNGFAGIVLRNPDFEISCLANVVPIAIVHAFDQIDVVHRGDPDAECHARLRQAYGAQPSLGSSGCDHARDSCGWLTAGLPAIGLAKAGGERGIDSLRSGLRPKPPLARRFAWSLSRRFAPARSRGRACFRVAQKLAEREGFEPSLGN